MAFSSLAGRKRHCSQPCVSSGALFPLNVCFRSFLGTWRFLVHIHWSVLISTTHYSRGSVFSYTCTDQYIKYWVLKGNPGDSREISLVLCIFLYFPVLCPMNSNVFDLLGLLNAFWTHGFIWAQPGFLFLHSTLETQNSEPGQ